MFMPNNSTLIRYFDFNNRIIFEDNALATNPRLESRLGCQCVILEDDAVIEVEIPNQSGIIGHEH